MIARGVLAAAVLAISACSPPLAYAADHDEPRPYAADIDAMTAVDAALSRATLAGKRVILVMGANWCHDSRGLAEHLESARFAPLIAGNFEVVYVDAGRPRDDEAANMDVARRFGVEALVGTPNVFILSAAGERLNDEEDVLGWRDAASRDPDDIHAYFEGYRAPDARGNPVR
ncbi:thioredoxin family protein [Pacificimonas sp. WHA3]|uniref:Thioredoxin family protein n=1 Tax=Pacificimonas pallii TaxID=2827236 RepID=A0ABS6SCU6_9SPHN|nr:thioredoxin family protein [Pacificimonas pallii]MBV7256254.1 thioredoxin family protein [Pacificimonas pallii]